MFVEQEYLRLSLSTYNIYIPYVINIPYVLLKECPPYASLYLVLVLIKRSTLFNMTNNYKHQIWSIHFNHIHRKKIFLFIESTNLKNGGVSESTTVCEKIGCITFGSTSGTSDPIFYVSIWIAKLEISYLKGQPCLPTSKFHPNGSSVSFKTVFSSKDLIFIRIPEFNRNLKKSSRRDYRHWIIF